MLSNRRLDENNLYFDYLNSCYFTDVFLQKEREKMKTKYLLGLILAIVVLVLSGCTSKTIDIESLIRNNQETFTLGDKFFGGKGYVSFSGDECDDAKGIHFPTSDYSLCYIDYIHANPEGFIDRASCICFPKEKYSRK